MGKKNKSAHAWAEEVIRDRGLTTSPKADRRSRVATRSVPLPHPGKRVSGEKLWSKLGHHLESLVAELSPAELAELVVTIPAEDSFDKTPGRPGVKRDFDTGIGTTPIPGKSGSGASDLRKLAALAIAIEVFNILNAELQASRS